MYRWVFIVFFIFISIIGRSQRSFFLPKEEPDKTRIIGSSATIGTLWAGSLIGLHQVWYSQSWGDNFHTFDDSKQWLQMDKAGHFFSGHLFANNISEVYQWSGVSRKRSKIISSLISFGYLTSFELMDGRAKEWGFSWSDVGANALGSGWYLWQDIAWEEQRIKLKFSAHMTTYADYRPNVLGSTFAERLLKDYNGQTYWFSVNPSMFLNDDTSFPKWLSIAFGYSVDQKIVGDQDEYVHFGPLNEITYFNAKRQYILSLDIDLSRLPVKKPWLKTLCKTFNIIKIPFPAIQISDGKLKGYPLYF